jgi:hypothetical protein
MDIYLSGHPHASWAHYNQSSPVGASLPRVPPRFRNQRKKGSMLILAVALADVLIGSDSRNHGTGGRAGPIQTEA